MVEVDVALLAFVAGTVIPLLTGLLTKLEASSQIKATVNLLLSVVAGAVAFLLQNSGSASWMEVTNSMVLVYLSSGVSYQNFWKPTGVAETVQVKTESIGVGG